MPAPSVSAPTRAIAYMHPRSRGRLPPGWAGTFGGYPYFYAPGYQLFARERLGIRNKHQFCEQAEACRLEAPKNVPTSLVNEVPPVQPADWTKLGPNQIQRAYEESNCGFAKLVMSLVVLQMLADARGVAVNVFDTLRFHTAIHHFSDFNRRYFAERVVDVPAKLDGVCKYTLQKKDFIRSFGDGAPATLPTVLVIEEWLKKNLKGAQFGPIQSLDERTMKAARRERPAYVQAHE
jgi:hypothetical protein